MKNTVGKGILFYLLVFLAIITGVACILMCILIFSPGTEIFGISYFSNKATEFITECKDENSATCNITDLMTTVGKVETISIDTNYYTICVENENEFFGFKIDANTSGLVKNVEGDDLNSTIIYSAKYNSETKVLSFSVTEPNAVLFFSKSGKIKFCVPENRKTAINAKSFNVVTNEGNVIFSDNEAQDIQFSSLTANVNSGKLVINSRTKIFSSTNVTSTSGNIDIQGILYAGLTINTDKGKIIVSNVTGETRIISKSSIISLGTITGKLYYESDKGVLNATKITGDFECAEETKVSTIKVGEVGGQVLLPCSESSNITLNKTLSNVLIKTKGGSVTIGEAQKSVTVEAENCNVTVVVNQTSISDINNSINITTTSGDIVARYKKVLGKNTLSTSTGKVLVKYVSTCIFDLVYDCSKSPTATQGISTIPLTNNGIVHYGHTSPATTSEINDKVIVSNTSGNTTFDDTMKSTFELDLD